MEAPTFVSKARMAFHSAAAKAERVLMDFKFDQGSPHATSPPHTIITSFFFCLLFLFHLLFIFWDFSDLKKKKGFGNDH